MSSGKACGKQAAQYAGKQPDEGSSSTSPDTAAPENEEDSSGHTHTKSMRLTERSSATKAGGLGEGTAKESKKLMPTQTRSKSNSKQPGEQITANANKEPPVLLLAKIKGYSW